MSFKTCIYYISLLKKIWGIVGSGTYFIFIKVIYIYIHKVS